MRVFFIVLLAMRAIAQSQDSPGSIYSEVGRYADLASDLRARRVGDTITIVVSDRLSAISEGVSSAARKSSAKASITSLAGNRSTVGALANLAGLSGDNSLAGSGSTSRSNVLTTTVSGRVVEVLPNGDLVVSATKDIGVNAEKHQIAIRGIVRWTDVAANNTVQSNRVSQMAISLNGKGLVSDSIRRPNILYRLLLGILPF
ncbi:flagellar basal body L-ring protein FlgH [Bryobacter aggregatus]|uniref:flagellar basal body L-ring protein FlgH n=1 Tax=Bryobacter aggregatus TaxID=360054 RepID=UPI00068D29B4|nr:flagellar basal body L-ring protein FlgH [Bryobacter aggregatus]